MGAQDSQFQPPAGPHAPPDDGSPPRRSRTPSLSLLAMIVACVALLLGVGAVSVATMAATRAVRAAGDAERARGAAERQRAQAHTQPTPAGPEAAVPTPEATGLTGESEPTEAADAPSATEPPPLDQRTVYEVKYAKQSLTLKAKDCYSMHADLDEPRANVGAEVADMSLAVQCGGDSKTFQLGDGVEGSEEGASGMTPQDCAERIRTAPLGEAAVPVRKGVVLCIATSFAAAQQRGDVRRMVLLEVTGVAADGAVTVQADAWDIPR